jgi:hypothetical protein
MAGTKICTIEGCEKRAFARGWCAGHYHRWRQHGSTEGGRHARESCNVDGCGEPHKAKGFCSEHYYAWRRHGDPLARCERTEPGALLEWLHRNSAYQADECLLWPFAVYPNGYGHIAHEGVETTAHRVMCRIAHGDPPQPEMEAAHSCNVRPCCNPRHLRWATKQENMDDMERFGTRPEGERNPRAKLTADDVREIRRLKGRIDQSALGARFGVTKSTVSLIQLGRTWRSVS